MAEIIPHSGLTLLQSFMLAREHGMHLIEIGGEVKISPIIPPGAREIPIKVKIVAPDRGRVVVCHAPSQVAA